MIEPNEAQVVRFIFRAFLEGFTIQEIARKLREAQVPSGAGKSNWPVATVRYILSNERYMGHAVLQKTLTKDFLTHKIVKNTGQLPQYYLTNSHPPIVPEEVFRLVQRELVCREVVGHPGQRKYSLSGKVICGRCGTEYKRFTGGRMQITPAIPGTSEDGQISLTAVDDHAEVDCAAKPSMIAVWKCKARFSAKDAEKARARLAEASANSCNAENGANARNEKKGNTRNSGKASWRCTNTIVTEEQINTAVEKALMLLPFELDNIKVIQESCRARVRDRADTDEISNHVAEAQLLLLHCDTMLRYLEQVPLGIPLPAGTRLTSIGTNRASLPCKTFDQFIATAPVDLGDTEDPIEMLIEAVVVDGEKITVRFKAGVEI